MTKTDWDGSYAAVVEWARPFQPDCPGLGRTKLPRSGKLSKGRRWGLRLPGDYDYSNKKPRSGLNQVSEGTGFMLAVSVAE